MVIVDEFSVESLAEKEIANSDTIMILTVNRPTQALANALYAQVASVLSRKGVSASIVISDRVIDIAAAKVHT